MFSLNRATPSRPRRRTRAVVLAPILLLVVGVLGGATELWLRASAENDIEDAFGQRLGSEVDVNFAASPMLLQPITGDIPDLAVRADHAKICTWPEMVLTAHLRDITVNSTDPLDGTVGHAEAEITLSATSLQALLNTVLGATLPIQVDVLDGVLRLSAGALTADLTPTIAGDHLVLSPAGSRIDTADLLLGWLGVLSVPIPAAAHLPLGLAPTGLTVSATGLRIRLASTNADLGLPPSAAETCPPADT